MVMECHDHMSGDGVTLSSIALLQERFRQLQRMKELREEKELLRMLSESERRHSPPPVSHTEDHYYKLQQKTFPCQQLKSQQVPRPKPQCQLLSLSLWPDSQHEHAGPRTLQPVMQEDPSDLAKSWFADATQLVCTSPVKLEQCGGLSDIDLSLRL